jgi:cysteine-rich repeat protein
VCAGPARDCSAFTTVCALGTCDEPGDRCYGVPRAEGTACNDSLWCTNPDTCTAGVCGGPARDCSAAADQCNNGVCNETGDVCFPDPLPAGTLCDADGSAATRDICLTGTCDLSACGDGFRDTGASEYCDDGNTVTEACRPPSGTPPPAGSCVRDCSIRQDTCGNGIHEPEWGEQCDDGDNDSFDACTTSCTINDFGVGAPCTCTGSCPVGDPTAPTISGCSGVVAPTGSLVGCTRSGSLGGGALYFARGFCTAWAHRCSPSLLCAFAGIPSSRGNYSAFVGPCPAGSVLVQQTITSSGVTLETKSCQKASDSDSDCRWNEYDPYYSRCGHYECIASPSTPGTRVCFDSQMSPP